MLVSNNNPVARNRSGKNAVIITALLILLMVTTRPHTFHMLTHLPNASVAIFFAGGFYLRRYILFGLFFAVVMLLDFLSITLGNVSSFCISPAYWFMIPTYAVCWEMGKISGKFNSISFRSLFVVWSLAFLASTFSFIISNGSFYFISGSYPAQNWTEYVLQFKSYYADYVISACVYVAVLSVIHVIVAFLHKNLDTERSREKELKNVGKELKVPHH